jgi:maltooligosyltrehalose trehalohydrolase
LVLIAESDLNDPRLVTPRAEGGLGMDAQWSDDFHHALIALLHPGPAQGYYADFGSMGQLAKALEQTFVYDGIYSRYRDRIHGRQAGHLPQQRFLVFIQNHDQVGNSAIGARLREVIGLDRAKIAAGVAILSPFVPLLFQGEEWAASSPFQYFADHEEPEMARLVSEGRKKEFAAFGWDPNVIPDPEDRRTFERCKLNWNELDEGDHAEMLAWYRALIRLRRSTPALNNGEPGQTRVRYDPQQMWFCMERGEIHVSCNLDDVPHSFPVAEGGRIVLGSREALTVMDGAVTLPPNTLAVITVN